MARYEVQGLYGDDPRDWDRIVTEDTRREALEMLAAYDRNEPGVPHRIKKVKEIDPDAVVTYRIVRMFESDDFDKEVLKRGLTLEEAQEYCNGPETSSKTATGVLEVELTERVGPWFDGYEQE
jgi:hypothetical protein